MFSLNPKPVQELPEGYQRAHVINFQKGVWILVFNLLSIPAALLFGGLFLDLATLIRGEGLSDMFSSVSPRGDLLLFLLLTIMWVILHELIHGLGFWWFTRTRPAFGLTIFAVYAGAPGWYLPRNHHLVIGIAPFLLLTLLGLGLLFILSSSLALIMVGLMTVNAMGATGDLAVCALALFQPQSALVHDGGLEISIYRPAKIPDVNSGG